MADEDKKDVKDTTDQKDTDTSKKTSDDTTKKESDTKLSEELGAAKKEKEILQKYKEQVDPVLQTLWGDPELMKELETKHNKRLGIKTDSDDEKDPDNKSNKKVVEKVVVDHDNVLASEHRDLEC